MRILVEINHPSVINLFKATISELKKRGHHIILVVLKRGNLPLIVSKELENMKFILLGEHRGGILPVILETNIIRFFKMFFFVLTNNIDIGLSFGNFILGMSLKLKGKPNIQVDDDIERKVNIFLEKLTCSVLLLPYFHAPSKKIKTFNALKEWAYLSPRYFNPNVETIKRYGVAAKEFIFIREISPGSLNYITQKPNLIASFSGILPAEFKVLLSLEDKNTRYLYPKSWILLEEPVEDFHSLLYYSRLIISTGDTVAREGSVLGVPAIYCGNREMLANKVMIEKGMLFKSTSLQMAVLLNKILSSCTYYLEKQDKFRMELLKEWDDLAEIIVNQIEEYG